MEYGSGGREVFVDYEKLTRLAPELSSRVLRYLLVELWDMDATDENNRSVERIEHELELRRGQGE